MVLSKLSKGRLAKIVSFEIEDSAFAERLKALGFEENTFVEVLHYGFPARDPIAVRLEDHMVALGKDEADCIKVEKI